MGAGAGGVGSGPDGSRGGLGLPQDAQAEVKEKQAELELAKNSPNSSLCQARLEAAQGRLTSPSLPSTAVRSVPRSRGTIFFHAFVSEGQFVTRGTVLAELADVTSLKSMIVLSLAEAKLWGAGGGGRRRSAGHPARVNAVSPLSDSMATLRELAIPMVAASVVVSNVSGEFEPGQKTHGLTVPDAPITLIPPSAIHAADNRAKEKTKAASAGDAPTVQVIRNEYVTTIKGGACWVRPGRIGCRSPARFDRTTP